MEVAEKKQLKCRAAGCAGVFGYHAARIKHEEKEHGLVSSKAVAAKPKKVKRSKRKKVQVARSSSRLTAKDLELLGIKDEEKPKETVVPVTLNYCPFCARALPNAHVVMNGRH